MKGNDVGLGISVGAGVGVALGVVFGDIALGIALGAGSVWSSAASSISPTGVEEAAMHTAGAESAHEHVPNSVFGRVVAGVDGTEPGFEAARQAARLVAADGWLEVFTAVYLVEANLTGWSASRVAEELEREAGEASRRAATIAGPRATSRLVNGPPLLSLMRELKKKEATLAVVGTHGHRRLAEIMIGGVAGELLHNAPCSVLIARRQLADALFPRAIVAGADGSPESEAAIAAAQTLANRFAVPLRIVTALEGKPVDLARVQRKGPIEAFDEHPVRALVHASMDADILVVGSRGLHGLRSLGSVSERVAHQAPCSVLVVRAGSG
jgi:nucleotide-binding universal stress UspA family protein